MNIDVLNQLKRQGFTLLFRKHNEIVTLICPLKDLVLNRSIH